MKTLVPLFSSEELPVMDVHPLDPAPDWLLETGFNL